MQPLSRAPMTGRRCVEPRESWKKYRAVTIEVEAGHKCQRDMNLERESALILLRPVVHLHTSVKESMSTQMS